MKTKPHTTAATRTHRSYTSYESYFSYPPHTHCSIAPAHQFPSALLFTCSTPLLSRRLGAALVTDSKTKDAHMLTKKVSTFEKSERLSFLTQNQAHQRYSLRNKRGSGTHESL